MLSTVRTIFEQFHQRDLNYCVYKGLDHLEESLNGDHGDVDFLVDEPGYEQGCRILESAGFKKISGLFSSPYEALYIGYDPETTRSSYLHLCKRIFVNTKYVKYRIPLEERILSKRTYDSDRKIWTTDQESLSQFVSIRTQIRNGAIKKALRENKADENFAAAKREPAETLIRLIDILFHKVRRFLRYPELRIAGNGKIIVFQGIDGCGKSTQTSLITNADYFRKTGMKLIYGGFNDFRFPFLNRIKRRLETQGAKGPLMKFERMLLPLLAILERRWRMVAACLYKWKGYLVVFDRYFYDDIVALRVEMSEGKMGAVKRALKYLMHGWVGVKPDYVFFLNIDPHESFRRKGEHTIEFLTRISDEYKKIFEAGNEKRYVCIDAEQPMDVIHKLITDRIRTSKRS